MMKSIIKIVTYIFLFLGLTQFFLIPGYIWNFLLPLIIVFTGLVFYNRKKIPTTNFFKYSLYLLVGILVLEGTHKFILSEHLSRPNAPIEIKVMTYNLFFKNRSPSQSLEVIKNASPDILVVQELTPSWTKHLSNSLGTQYPYKYEYALKGTHGLGIYSKYKITSKKSIKNSSNLPIALVTELMFNGKKVQLVNLHLASPAVAVENKDRFFSLYYQNYKLRKAQLNKINDKVLSNNNQFDCQLLVGDFNTMRHEPIFKTLKWDWLNTYEKQGQLFKSNFPHSANISPIITLDYILARGKSECLGSKILQGGSSDHLAVMSILKI